MCSPCKGSYADIAVETSGERKVEEMRKFDQLIKNYEEFTKKPNDFVQLRDGIVQSGYEGMFLSFNIVPKIMIQV